MRINRRKIKFYRKKYSMILTFTLILMMFSIGYAVISTTLSVNGTSKMANATWNVHFDNIQTKTGSVTPTTAPTISNNTSVSFSARLENPGDFYEFNIDVVNGGSIDAMIDSYTMTPTLTTDQQKYFNYSVTYSDGVALAANQLLAHNSTETLKVRFEYLTSNDINDYPEEDQTFNFNLSIDYVQKDEDVIDVPHALFDEDTSWEAIITAIQNSSTSNMTVGSTKTVDMGTFGTHTLRVANNSTPEECSTTGFSQTACGFVLEFADLISNRKINGANFHDVIGSGNIGGWEYSETRTYVNSDIYNALPSTLKSSIIDTIVVSGYGSYDTANIITTDKLYLFSPHEIMEDVDNNPNAGIDYYDKSYSNTRQLDYYKNNNVTTSSYSGAIKQYNSNNSNWWLRSAPFDSNQKFFNILNDGSMNSNYSDDDNGISPAFRIG